MENNLFILHEELLSKQFIHQPYQSFYVRDPKLRHIHKATVYDRVLHQAIFRVLYSIFDCNFIEDSYSCRVDKGTHRGVLKLEKIAKSNIFAVKCDIKKFFDSVDQGILSNLIKKRIKDENTLWLIEKIIKSFEKEKERGLPLGNVTSQLFANIYLNELDYFVKNKLKIENYLRYCDDFIILGNSKEYLMEIVGEIDHFLKMNLKLQIHQNKIILRKRNWGIDFLGYIVLPNYKLLRTKTKKRIFKKLLNNKISEQALQSYFGILKHCQGYKIKEQIKKIYNIEIIEK
ncbi:MAG: reverse transcriptase/maturase family protein [Patescibacteria group bacterium]